MMEAQDMSNAARLDDELLEYLDEDDPIAPFLNHPLLTILGVEQDDPEQVERLNWALRSKRERLRQAVEAKDWGLVLMLYEKPWRLKALIDYGPMIESDREYYRELGETWMQVESGSRDGPILPALLNPCGRDPRERRFMMTDEEQAALQELPEPVTIFRGCGPVNEQGWSWTLDEELAEWFACRFPDLFDGQVAGFVLEGRCRKSAIIAYLSRRNEDEILIDPAHVEIIRRIEIDVQEEDD
jgi:hypothetical protein